MNNKNPWVVEYETYVSRGQIKRRFKTEAKARVFHKKLVRRFRSAIMSASVYHEVERAAISLRLNLHKILVKDPVLSKAWESLKTITREDLMLAQQSEIQGFLEKLGSN